MSSLRNAATEAMWLFHPIMTRSWAWKRIGNPAQKRSNSQAAYTVLLWEIEHLKSWTKTRHWKAPFHLSLEFKGFMVFWFICECVRVASGRVDLCLTRGFRVASDVILGAYSGRSDQRPTPLAGVSGSWCHWLSHTNWWLDVAVLRYIFCWLRNDKCIYFLENGFKFFVSLSYNQCFWSALTFNAYLLTTYCRCFRDYWHVWSIQDLWLYLFRSRWQKTAMDRSIRPLAVLTVSHETIRGS